MAYGLPLGPRVSPAQGLFLLCAFEMHCYYVAALRAKYPGVGEYSAPRLKTSLRKQTLKDQLLKVSPAAAAGSLVSVHRHSEFEDLRVLLTRPGFYSERHPQLLHFTAGREAGFSATARAKGSECQLAHFFSVRLSRVRSFCLTFALAVCLQINAVSLYLLYLVEMISSGLQIVYNTDEVRCPRVGLRSLGLSVCLSIPF